MSDTISSQITRLLVYFILFTASSMAFSLDEDITLLVYGDSLSAAYGIEEEQGWVTLLSQKLEDERLSVIVVNGSVSGETTTGGLVRLPAMLENYSPDLVILELGGNDGLRGLPLELLKQNLEEMIDLSTESGAEVLLTGIQIPPNYGPRYTLPFFRLYAELANKKVIPLVPFLIDRIPQQPELMQSDGIHPKAEAQFMILENVWPELEPMLEDLLRN
ncbi:MAG: arylesterase [Gammaproteobacteria bacterium]|jgi:acyl-CoA thioesterase-1|nr:arylesterase [Gammaproteobacteria bacterium]MBT3860466.1 arylesterase [Gammaproteobacteria bacterium]MBT3987915.1 arylesterase [Gammaproteobacteria bacterium]MBT4256552.1 arylesterase [Gammaproteobacteria bacterium]MBT4582442.1 arylesterase [Gammaproteobacteria bacterium]